MAMIDATGLCPIGKRISALTNDLITRADGTVTALYYHIRECDRCADEREKQRQKYLPKEDTYHSE